METDKLSDPIYLSKNVLLTEGKLMVPGITWVKDFYGQTTNGRTGRPATRWIPLSWLPVRLQQQVKERLNDERRRNYTN